jgi:hypothetical protein
MIEGATLRSPVGSPFSDHRLDLIHRHWQTRCAGRIMPQRADIRPSELGAALRLLNLVDVLHSPLRFRHRLVGSEHVEWLGRNATGRDIDDTLYGAATGEIFNAFATIVREQRPYCRLSRLDWNNQKWLMMEAVELPLADSDGRVNMILRGAIFRPRLMNQQPAFFPLD